jgi:hypothetical protein
VRLQKKESWISLWTDGIRGRFLAEWVVGFAATLLLLALLTMYWEHLR